MRVTADTDEVDSDPHPSAFTLYGNHTGISAISIILVAEDQDEVRTVVRVVLERVGYEVVEAIDGTAALARFEEAPADLVVTDMLMPGKSGLELIMHLRRRHPDLCIIAMSGIKEELNEAERFGASRVLVKPFTPQELVAVVRDALATR